MIPGPWPVALFNNGGLQPGKLYVLKAAKKKGKPSGILKAIRDRPLPQINDGDRVALLPFETGPKITLNWHLNDPHGKALCRDVAPGTRGRAYEREKCNCCVLVIFDRVAGLPRQVAKDRLRRINLLEAIAEASL